MSCGELEHRGKGGGQIGCAGWRNLFVLIHPGASLRRDREAGMRIEPDRQVDAVARQKATPVGEQKEEGN